MNEETLAYPRLDRIQLNQMLVCSLEQVTSEMKGYMSLRFLSQQGTLDPPQTSVNNGQVSMLFYRKL